MNDKNEILKILIEEKMPRTKEVFLYFDMSYDELTSITKKGIDFSHPERSDDVVVYRRTFGEWLSYCLEKVSCPKVNVHHAENFNGVRIVIYGYMPA